MTILDFLDKEIQIIKGSTIGVDYNRIKIIFDGKEIARGTMTESGPEVELNESLKGGFFFAKTDEEKAFEKALEVLKTKI